MQLLVLLFQPLVKLWQFCLDVLLDVSLLTFNNLDNFVFEFALSLLHEFLQLVEHGVHERRQIFDEGFRKLLAFLDLLV